MTINEVMFRHNFIVKVLLKDGNKELSKDLKVKIMDMRIKLGKVRKELEADLQEFAKGITPEGYQELAQKLDKTEEEKSTYNTLTKKITEDYNAYVEKRGKEDIEIDTTLTVDEFNEIVDVNSGNDTEINGQKINAADFLEVLYNLFVV